MLNLKLTKYGLNKITGMVEMLLNKQTNENSDKKIAEIYYLLAVIEAFERTERQGLARETEKRLITLLRCQPGALYYMSSSPVYELHIVTDDLVQIKFDFVNLKDALRKFDDVKAFASKLLWKTSMFDGSKILIQHDVKSGLLAGAK